MELIKFEPASIPSELSNARPITGYTSAMWVERYLDPGEFEIVAPLSSGLRELLPTGSIIAHLGTTEAAIVENHHIVEDKDSDPVITITGRSLESILEQRIVGTHQNWSSPPATMTDTVLAANYPYLQVVSLIQSYISEFSVIDPNNAMLKFQCSYYISGLPGTSSPERIVKRGNLLQRVQELLAADDYGIKVLRRLSVDSTGNGGYSSTFFLIHRGLDKSKTVVFSWLSGHLDDAEYLWSNKSVKNAALVVGRYVETIVVGTETGYNRRWMIVDADDIDGNLTEVPVEPELSAIRAKMVVRGQDAIKAQRQVNITRANVSATASYTYRKDYNIGDIVTVEGNYGASTKMRVVEYVEIQDENGEYGHPTLSALQ